MCWFYRFLSLCADFIAFYRFMLILSLLSLCADFIAFYRFMLILSLLSLCADFIAFYRFVLILSLFIALCWFYRFLSLCADFIAFYRFVLILSLLSLCADFIAFYPFCADFNTFISLCWFHRFVLILSLIALCWFHSFLSLCADFTVYRFCWFYCMLFWWFPASHSLVHFLNWFVYNFPASPIAYEMRLVIEMLSLSSLLSLLLSRVPARPLIIQPNNLANF